MWQMTLALYIMKQVTYSDATDVIESYHHRLWRSPARFCVFLKRWFFQRWQNLWLFRKREQVALLWKYFFKLQTKFPNTLEGEGAETRGLPPYGAIRATLIGAGFYNSNSIMDAPFLQVMHDYAWVRRIRVEAEKDLQITEMLKAHEEAMRKGQEDGG